MRRNINHYSLAVKLFLRFLFIVFALLSFHDLSYCDILPIGYEWKNSYILLIDTSTGEIIKTINDESGSVFNPYFQQNLLSFVRQPSTLKNNQCIFDIINIENMAYEHKSLPGVDESLFDVSRLRRYGKLKWYLHDDKFFYLHMEDSPTNEFNLVAKNWKNGNTLWIVNFKEKEYIYPVWADFYSDSIILIASINENGILIQRVYSIDKESGRINWHFDGVSFDPWFDSISISSDKIVIISRNRSNRDNAWIIQTINATNGGLIHEMNINSNHYVPRVFGKPPVVVGGQRNYDTGIKYYAAINPFNGDEIWGEDSSFSLKFCADEIGFYTTNTKLVSRINPATGETMWELDPRETTNESFGDIFCERNSLILSGWDGKNHFLILINKKTGEEITKQPVYASNMLDAFLEDNNRLIVVYDDKYVVCYSISNGKELWKWDVPEGYKIHNYDFSDSENMLALTVGDRAFGVK